MKALLSKRTNEVALLGDSVGWREFVANLRSGATAIACEVAEPLKYEASAKVIQINQSTEILLSIDILGESTLAITGNSTAIDWFINFVEAFANHFIVGSHIHLDSVGNEGAIKEGSPYTVLQMT